MSYAGDVGESSSSPLDDIHHLQLLKKEDREELNAGYDPLEPLPPAFREGEEPIPGADPGTFGYSLPAPELQGLRDALVTGTAEVVDWSEQDGTVTVDGDRYVQKEPMYPLCPDVSCSSEDIEVDRLDFYVLYEQTVTLDPDNRNIIVSDDKADYSAEKWDQLLDEVNDKFCPDYTDGD